MKHKLIFLFLVLAYTAQVCAFGQEESLKKRRLTIIPREVALPVVAYQPNCPLQFENVVVLASLDHGSGPDFQLRNRSNKAMRSVSYAVWNSEGGGSIDSWPTKITSEPVMPGDIIPLGDGLEQELVPMTKEIREKFKLDGGMKAIIVLMVLRVEFTDGTFYSDEKTFASLKSYFGALGDCPHR